MLVKETPSLSPRVGLSYLSNGNLYSGKTAYLYLDPPSTGWSCYPGILTSYHLIKWQQLNWKWVTSIWCQPAPTVYPKKYAHGFVVLCFVVVTQSFIMNSHEVFIHIHQGCFAGTGAIVRLPQCQWSKPDGYGKISQCITTTKHSKAKTVSIFLGIYCKFHMCCIDLIHAKIAVSQFCEFLEYL